MVYFFLRWFFAFIVLLSCSKELFAFWRSWNKEQKKFFQFHQKRVKGKIVWQKNFSLKRVLYLQLFIYPVDEKKRMATAAATTTSRKKDSMKWMTERNTQEDKNKVEGSNKRTNKFIIHLPPPPTIYCAWAKRRLYMVTSDQSKR